MDHLLIIQRWSMILMPLSLKDMLRTGACLLRKMGIIITIAVTQFKGNWEC